MESKYYIYIPGLICEKECDINNWKVQNLNLENCAQCDDSDSENLKLIHKGLLLNTGIKNKLFSFIIYTSLESETDAIININKIMSVFFYSVLIGNINTQDQLYDNSLLTYYICTEPKRHDYEDDLYIMFQFRFNGIKMQYCSYLNKEKYYYEQSPYIIFDSNNLKYFINFKSYSIQEIKAMDRFIAARRSQNDGDYINTYLNLLYAFENIITLHGSAKAREFSDKIRDYLRSGVAAEWAKEFYKIRGLIAHGSNKFLWPNFYLNREPKNKTERTIYWKHPDGSSYYLPHLYLGAEVFRIIFDCKYLGEKPNLRYIESLFTVNEIIYNEIKKLIESKMPFGQEYYNLISSLKLNDTTGNKDDIKTLIQFIIEFLIESDLGLNDLTNKLQAEKEYSPKFNLIIYKIGEEVSNKRSQLYGNTYDEKSFMLFRLSDLIRKIHYSLSANPAL